MSSKPRPPLYRRQPSTITGRVGRGVLAGVAPLEDAEVGLIGVVGAIASRVDRHYILIGSFAFSHRAQRTRSTVPIRVAKDRTDEVIDELRSREHITTARELRI